MHLDGIVVLVGRPHWASEVTGPGAPPDQVLVSEQLYRCRASTTLGLPLASSCCQADSDHGRCIGQFGDLRSEAVPGIGRQCWQGNDGRLDARIAAVAPVGYDAAIG